MSLSRNSVMLKFFGKTAVDFMLTVIFFAPDKSANLLLRQDNVGCMSN